MIRRLRLILPPGTFLFVFAILFVLLEAPFWYAHWRFGAPLPERRPSLSIIVFVALAHGAGRVTAFHPFYRPSYREWLARTPWTPRKPLPVGPVSWILEDGFVLLALAALAQAGHMIDPVLVVGLCLMSYGLMLTMPLFATGAPVIGYLSMFVLGLATWLSPIPWALLVAAVAASLLALVGFRRSLDHFPWSLPWQETISKTGKLFENQNRAQCGWPYDRLGPLPPQSSRFTWTDAALSSMLAGWWLFALASLDRDPDSRPAFFAFFLGYGAMFCVLFRTLKYCNGYAPPLSLWGRLLTFRWIIPRYDQIFLGPICALLAPVLAKFVFVNIMPRDVAYSTGFALMLFVTFTCPPSLKRWRLTGEHRIVATGHTKTEFIQVG